MGFQFNQLLRAILAAHPTYRYVNPGYVEASYVE